MDTEKSCPLCDKKLSTTDLSIVKFFCDKCGAGFDQKPDKKTLLMRYKNLISVSFWIDFLFIEIGVVYLLDIIATFLITFRFLNAGILGRIPLYGWLFQILGIRLLIYVLIERSALGSLYGILQSTIDAFSGFILLMFVQNLGLQMIISESNTFQLILLVSAISSWLSIILLFSRIRKLRKISYQRKKILTLLQTTKK